MNCLRCNEPMEDLAPNLPQPSGICCECFGEMADEAASNLLLSDDDWEAFLKSFEQGLSAMRRLLENKA